MLNLVGRNSITYGANNGYVEALEPRNTDLTRERGVWTPKAPLSPLLTRTQDAHRRVNRSLSIVVTGCSGSKRDLGRAAPTFLCSHY